MKNEVSVTANGDKAVINGVEYRRVKKEEKPTHRFKPGDEVVVKVFEAGDEDWYQLNQRLTVKERKITNCDREPAYVFEGHTTYMLKDSQLEKYVPEPKYKDGQKVRVIGNCSAIHGGTYHFEQKGTILTVYDSYPGEVGTIWYDFRETGQKIQEQDLEAYEPKPCYMLNDGAECDREEGKCRWYDNRPASWEDCVFGKSYENDWSTSRIRSNLLLEKLSRIKLVDE